MQSNTQEFTGDWDEIKGKLKKQFTELSLNREKNLNGMQDDLLGRIEKKLGQTNEEILKQIS